MIYLLDVNTVVALAYAAHASHGPAARWYAARRQDTLYLSPGVEMGFLRVSVHARLQPDVPSARAVLSTLKQAANFGLLTDDTSADDLPAYVTTARQVSDGHLLALAHRHGGRLATLDSGIPGAEPIV